MLLIKVLKYKILEYCLDTLFEKLYSNLIDTREYLPLSVFPQTGYIYQELYCPSHGWHFKNCRVDGVFINSEENNTKIMQVSSKDALHVFGGYTFWIRQNTDYWYYKV